MFDLMINNIPPEQRDPFTNMTTEMVKKAKLKRSQWNLLISYGLLLTFILAYSFIPALYSTVPLTNNDIRVAFWIGTSLFFLLMFAFSLPDIIKGFKKI
ncbi:hypothetical protein [Alteribacter populi]|uniref:hypothetical protein n=1 Tax=Alteribacter populi TaxID=2011011 RepID=UPI000BBA7738|nr:hypothetical protein [Alteribacter populi]